MHSRTLLALTFSWVLCGTAWAELPQQSDAYLKLGAASIAATCSMGVGKSRQEATELFDSSIFFLDKKYREQWGVSLFDALRTFYHKEPRDGLAEVMANLPTFPQETIMQMCRDATEELDKWMKPTYVNSLVTLWLAQNNICRGATQPAVYTKACDARELLAKKLSAEGWCYGQRGQSGNQMTWHSCNANSLH